MAKTEAGFLLLSPHHSWTVDTAPQNGSCPMDCLSTNFISPGHPNLLTYLFLFSVHMYVCIAVSVYVSVWKPSVAEGYVPRLRFTVFSEAESLRAKSRVTSGSPGTHLFYCLTLGSGHTWHSETTKKGLFNYAFIFRCMSFLPVRMLVCAPCACPVPSEARRGHWIT